MSNIAYSLAILTVGILTLTWVFRKKRDKMVVKKFCDKCGAEIQAGIDNELSLTRVRRTRFGIDEWIHLCDGCLEKFSKWLKNES